MGKRKKEDDPILRKKKQKKNSVTIIIAVDGKETVFPMKLKLEVESFENFKKDVVDLIETNHQINMTYQYCILSKKSFKSHLNAKIFNMFF